MPAKNSLYGRDIRDKRQVFVLIRHLESDYTKCLVVYMDSITNAEYKRALITRAKDVRHAALGSANHEGAWCAMTAKTAPTATSTVSDYLRTSNLLKVIPTSQVTMALGMKLSALNTILTRYDTNKAAVRTLVGGLNDLTRNHD